MLYSYTILIVGVLCCSTAVIFIKLSDVDPVLLAAYRLALAGVMLAPFFLQALKRHPEVFMRRYFKRTLWPALILGLHMILWNVGARLTPAVNSTLIVNTVPIVMPFILFFMVREVVNRVEVAGTCIALAGVLLLGVSDYHFSPEHALGDAVCFASMVLYAVYLAFARRNRDFVSIWFYLAPVYLGAGLICLALGLIGWAAFGLIESPFRSYPGRDLLLILGIALVPTVLGHSCLNYALKHLRGQTVTIINLGQFIFAGLMAYIVFAEIPGGSFYASSLLLMSGAAIVIRAAR